MTITKSPYTPHEPKGDPMFWSNARKPKSIYCSTCQRMTTHALGSEHRTAHGTQVVYVCQEHEPLFDGDTLHLHYSAAQDVFRNYPRKAAK